MYRDLGDGITVFAGRIRPGIRYICMGYNTVRGAVGASFPNAELLKKMGKL